jgi:hypothetical protein
MPPPTRSGRSEAVTHGDLPGREAGVAAVRPVKLVGVTGAVELDATGDRRKAVYSFSGSLPRIRSAGSRTGS